MVSIKLSVAEGDVVAFEQLEIYKQKLSAGYRPFNLEANAPLSTDAEKFGNDQTDFEHNDAPALFSTRGLRYPKRSSPTPIDLDKLDCVIPPLPETDNDAIKSLAARLREDFRLDCQIVTDRSWSRLAYYFDDLDIHHWGTEFLQRVLLDINSYYDMRNATILRFTVYLYATDPIRAESLASFGQAYFTPDEISQYGMPFLKDVCTFMTHNNNVIAFLAPMAQEYRKEAAQDRTEGVRCQWWSESFQALNSSIPGYRITNGTHLEVPAPLAPSYGQAVSATMPVTATTPAAYGLHSGEDTGNPKQPAAIVFPDGEVGIRAYFHKDHRSNGSATSNLSPQVSSNRVQEQIQQRVASEPLQESIEKAKLDDADGAARTVSSSHERQPLPESESMSAQQAATTQQAESHDSHSSSDGKENRSASQARSDTSRKSQNATRGGRDSRWRRRGKLLTIDTVKASPAAMMARQRAQGVGKEAAKRAREREISSIDSSIISFNVRSKKQQKPAQGPDHSTNSNASVQPKRSLVQKSPVAQKQRYSSAPRQQQSPASQNQRHSSAPRQHQGRYIDTGEKQYWTNQPRAASGVAPVPAMSFPSGPWVGEPIILSARHVAPVAPPMMGHAPAMVPSGPITPIYGYPWMSLPHMSGFMPPISSHDTMQSSSRQALDPIASDFRPGKQFYQPTYGVQRSASNAQRGDKNGSSAISGGQRDSANGQRVSSQQLTSGSGHDFVPNPKWTAAGLSAEPLTQHMLLQNQQYYMSMPHMYGMPQSWTRLHDGPQDARMVSNNASVPMSRQTSGADSGIAMSIASNVAPKPGTLTSQPRFMYQQVYPLPDSSKKTTEQITKKHAESVQAHGDSEKNIAFSYEQEIASFEAAEDARKLMLQASPSGPNSLAADDAETSSVINKQGESSEADDSQETDKDTDGHAVKTISPQIDNFVVELEQSQEKTATADDTETSSVINKQGETSEADASQMPNEETAGLAVKTASSQPDEVVAEPQQSQEKTATADETVTSSPTANTDSEVAIIDLKGREEFPPLGGNSKNDLGRPRRGPSTHEISSTPASSDDEKAETSINKVVASQMPVQGISEKVASAPGTKLKTVSGNPAPQAMTWAERAKAPIGPRSLTSLADDVKHKTGAAAMQKPFTGTSSSNSGKGSSSDTGQQLSFGAYHDQIDPLKIYVKGRGLTEEVMLKTFAPYKPSSIYKIRACKGPIGDGTITDDMRYTFVGFDTVQACNAAKAVLNKRPFGELPFRYNNAYKNGDRGVDHARLDPSFLIPLPWADTSTSTIPARPRDVSGAQNQTLSVANLPKKDEARLASMMTGTTSSLENRSSDTKTKAKRSLSKTQAASPDPTAEHASHFDNGESSGPSSSNRKVETVAPAVDHPPVLGRLKKKNKPQKPGKAVKLKDSPPSKEKSTDPSSPTRARYGGYSLRENDLPSPAIMNIEADNQSPRDNQSSRGGSPSRMRMFTGISPERIQSLARSLSAQKAANKKPVTTARRLPVQPPSVQRMTVAKDADPGLYMFLTHRHRQINSALAQSLLPSLKAAGSIAHSNAGPADNDNAESASTTLSDISNSDTKNEHVLNEDKGRLGKMTQQESEVAIKEPKAEGGKTSELDQSWASDGDTSSTDEFVDSRSSEGPPELYERELWEMSRSDEPSSSYREKERENGNEGEDGNHCNSATPKCWAEAESDLD